MLTFLIKICLLQATYIPVYWLNQPISFNSGIVTNIIYSMYTVLANNIIYSMYMVLANNMIYSTG